MMHLYYYETDRLMLCILTKIFCTYTLGTITSRTMLVSDVNTTVIAVLFQVSHPHLFCTHSIH